MQEVFSPYDNGDSSVDIPVRRRDLATALTEHNERRRLRDAATLRFLLYYVVSLIMLLIFFYIL